ncbi:GatB/YqeY domain-containing protein [Candidatus Parcubacteria bacterium]|nr:GatB/YqeY domain-containing protein [Patescibacteria group bacterium]MBU4467059.1 GatB/YqeY domain-containing protein [Patescibacteria group bacterium]MCG2688540.1 GatB/YqeY domain-containing protein [Candidatus Parcubacteria bacterium]
MTLSQRLHQDLKESQLKKDELKVSVLRLALASFNNKEIEKRTKLSKTAPFQELEELSKLTDEEMIEVLNSEAKKRKEAIIGFRQGQRPALAEKEEKELIILEEYLPKALSEDQLREMIKEAITVTNAKSAADFGKVMSELMPLIKKRGRADGNLVNQLVRDLLSKEE